MDNKSLLAIVLCILILIGYQALISYIYPRPDALPPAQRFTQADPDTPPSEVQQPISPSEPREAVERTPIQQQKTPSVTFPPEREITVETEAYSAVFTSLGGRLKSLRLKQYPESLKPDSPLLEIVHAGPYGEIPFAVRIEGKDRTLTDATLPYVVTGEPLFLLAEDQASLIFSGTTEAGVHFTKTYSFSGEGHGIGLEVEVSNIPFQASSLSLSWTEESRSQSESRYSVYGPVALIGRKFLYESASDWEAGEIYGPGNIRWAGFTNSYFLAGMMPLGDQQKEAGNARLFFSEDNGTFEARLSIPWSGENVSYTLYLGPKETSALNAVDPAFDRAIDFGWAHFIARPLVLLLRMLYSATGNYGVAIILLTIMVKLVFFPLSNKSFKSMSAMKKIQPQMERLREQYKDDKQKLNQETMELYRRYKVNPLGGCIPMLVQLPVFIGLYQGLLYAIELRQAPFFGWILDLSQPDRLGALAIPFVEPPGIPVLTLLMGGSMLVQQMMTPMTGDPMQQKMMLLMPVVFTAMFISFPAGLVLYWLINNILSVAQQQWYTRKYA